MRRYNPQEIEPKWQKRWKDAAVFEAKEDESKKKFYLLEMFPYPSGAIHMGHVRNYAIGDVVARYMRMRGYNVLHPMGWDAFGLPAENAAIDRGIHPADWTYSNIDNMRAQLKRLGFSYDWSREIATCDPEYYKFEQEVFTKLLEKGLAYRKKSYVNWCPKDQTVLANEQVVDGKCWRCGTEVEQKEMVQWFLKTTEYAEELLRDIDDKLQLWPEEVRIMQKNWIGRSEGAEIDFYVPEIDESLTVFTTRPDTLFGVTFMSIAPEHPLVPKLCKGKETEQEVLAFAERVKKEDKQSRMAEDYEKEGVFTGAYAINPATGDKVPIYAANFVVAEYGTGVVMAVPGHDQRDFEFAKKYGLPIKIVIQPQGETLDPDTMEAAYSDEGIMVNSGQFDGTPNKEGIKKVIEWLESKGKGRKSVQYRLRDWCVSRQRYWGCPIPIVYCDKCGVVPVPPKDLPVTLPRDVEFSPTGGSPLAKNEEFVHTTCPKCGGPARRETDTFDTFMESSWYYLRYTSPHYKEGMAEPNAAKYWLPVDFYIGGVEHAVGHLMYVRFFHKVLRDLGIVFTDEPAKQLLTQGMVCMETYRHPEKGWVFPHEVELASDGKYVLKETGEEVIRGRVEKMSKSKKNIVDPNKLIDTYGADTVRLFSLFAAPPEKSLEWSDSGVEGSHRFLNRIWRITTENMELLRSDLDGFEFDELSSDAKALVRKTHATIKKVSEDVSTERVQLNTAIAAIMELSNEISKFKPESDADKSVMKFAIETAIVLLSPFAPHMTEELWEMMGHEDMLVSHPWPKFDPSMLVADTVVLPVQINGKVRANLEVPKDLPAEEVLKLALELPNVKRHTEGKQIKFSKVIPGRMVTLAVK